MEVMSDIFSGIVLGTCVTFSTSLYVAYCINIQYSLMSSSKNSHLEQVFIIHQTKIVD